MDELQAKLIQLGVVVVDNLILAVPLLLMGGLVPYLIAKMKARTQAMTKDIEGWAVDAERDIDGRKKGPERHAFVKRLAQDTYPMARSSRLDTLISGPGKAAADEFRVSLPPDPEAS